MPVRVEWWALWLMSGGVRWVSYCGGSTSRETGGTFHMPACVGRWASW